MQKLPYLLEELYHMTYLELALLLDPLEKFIQDCLVLALRFFSDLSPMSLAAFVSRGLLGQDGRCDCPRKSTNDDTIIKLCYVLMER